jgi:hypothetical protein
MSNRDEESWEEAHLARTEMEASMDGEQSMERSMVEAYIDGEGIGEKASGDGAGAEASKGGRYRSKETTGAERAGTTAKQAGAVVAGAERRARDWMEWGTVRYCVCLSPKQSFS